ncbi:cystathionine gamma-synthase [Bacillus sp. FJAT-18017]|uniref:methionine biosynthesis PLP-dependent protein n=1 Tax=Bacillus sp. FJAT-18017 TaxID=1705566 RepID=UPI0006AFA9A5|nr:methionine biosynthesis PLP-dependent protein [Bacillus sp. FJAT-18017]ALC90480.1 cystathionine gamma-synthase [Bacillus sp. FJAT-18017]
MKNHHIQTDLVQIGNRSENTTGAVNPPIYLSTAYRHDGLGLSTGYDYTRTKNPTRALLEENVARLEQGDQGFACSSGMAAVQLVLSLFKTGDELIASTDLYGGTFRLFANYSELYKVKPHYVNCNETSEIEKVINENTKAIFIETPTNPLMQEIDIEKVSKVARKYGLLLIVDNTFLTPFLQKPIGLGADIVIHSATKYIGGHNDVLAGLVIAKGAELCERLATNHNSIGAVLSPFDSWLLIRGLKTLGLRMERHQQNASDIVNYFKERPEVRDVLYPGKGGMVSFRVQKEEWVALLLRNLKLISFAESLGGVESFITYPATQTHADIPEEIRFKNGIDNCLLRFSVGVEYIDDLKADLDEAFTKIAEEEKGHDRANVLI